MEDETLARTDTAPRGTLPGPGPEWGQRVLVVDDDALLRRSIARGLTRAGMEVRTAGDASEALAIAAGFRPRVVLSDLVLPGSDGVDLLRRVRVVLPDAERILITAHAEAARVLHDVGVSRVLVKPFDPEMLRLAIRSALEKADLVRERRRLAEIVERQNRELATYARDMRGAVAARAAHVVATKDLWERAFDAMSEPIAIVAADGAVRLANAAFARVSREDVRDVVGRPCWSVVEGAGTAAAAWPIVEGRLSVPRRAVFEVHGRDGGALEAAIAPMNDAGGHFVVALRDVAAESRDCRRAILGERLAGVADVADGLLHELGNPLGGVLALVEARRSEADVAAAERSVLAEIDDAAQRCRRVLAGLGAFANELRGAHAARAADGAGRIDVADAIKKAVDAARLATGGAAPLLFVQDGLPELRGEQPLFERALAALLTNAIEATRRARAEGSPLIEVRALRRGDAVYVEVADEGAGLPASSHRSVFTPYVSGKHTVEGAGLGLPFVRNVAESMDGHVDVSSGPEGGATFRLVVPVHSRSLS